MSSKEYLELLKERGVKSLSYYSSSGNHKNAVIYALIISSKEIKPAQGLRPDAMLTFYLSDPSIPSGCVSTSMFQRDISILGVVKEAEIIIIKNFVVNMFNGRPQIVINVYSKFATYISNKCTFSNCDITIEDKEIVTALHSSLIDDKKLIAEVQTPKKRPMLETKDIDDDQSKFFDYVGEIVRINNQGNRVTLTLTDYTINPLPIKDDINNSKVDKEYLINCTAWDELVNDCEYLKVGDYLKLQNCVKKISNFLEFSVRLHEEEKKVVLNKIEADDPALKKLIERGNKYLAYKKRKQYGAFPLYTDIGNVKRKVTSFAKIKQQKKPYGYRVQACISDIKPDDINQWIKSWCHSCNISSEAGQKCRKCQGETEFYFYFSLVLKDKDGDELTVYAYNKNAQELLSGISAESAFKIEETRDRLRYIINLATEDKRFFDFCLISEKYRDEFVYQFSRTKFVLEEMSD